MRRYYRWPAAVQIPVLIWDWMRPLQGMPGDRGWDNSLLEKMQEHTILEAVQAVMGPRLSWPWVQGFSNLLREAKIICFG